MESKPKFILSAYIITYNVRQTRSDRVLHNSRIRTFKSYSWIVLNIVENIFSFMVKLQPKLLTAEHNSTIAVQNLQRIMLKMKNVLEYVLYNAVSPVLEVGIFFEEQYLRNSVF